VRIANGSREDEGAKREWAKKITMVEGKQKGEDVVSSTKARRAAQEDPSSLEKFVSRPIKEWIEAEGLYKEGARQTAAL